MAQLKIILLWRIFNALIIGTNNNSSCQFGREQFGSANKATTLCSHGIETKQRLLDNLSYKVGKKNNCWGEENYGLTDQCTIDLQLPLNTVVDPVTRTLKELSNFMQQVSFIVKYAINGVTRGRAGRELSILTAWWGKKNIFESAAAGWRGWDGWVKSHATPVFLWVRRCYKCPAGGKSCSLARDVVWMFFRSWDMCTPRNVALLTHSRHEGTAGTNHRTLFLLEQRRAAGVQPPP